MDVLLKLTYDSVYYYIMSTLLSDNFKPKIDFSFKQVFASHSLVYALRKNVTLRAYP